MIEELRRLRDLLEAIETEFREIDEADLGDPACIYLAQDIVDRLLIQHEKPDPVKPNNCMRVPTPPPPPPPPPKPIPVKPPRPERQRPQLSQRGQAKPRKTRKPKLQGTAK